MDTAKMGIGSQENTIALRLADFKYLKTEIPGLVFKGPTYPNLWHW